MTALVNRNTDFLSSIDKNIQKKIPLFATWINMYINAIKFKSYVSLLPECERRM